MKRVIGSENNVGISDCGLEGQIPPGDTSLSQKEMLDLKGVDSVKYALWEAARF